jgi:hypothetical protein
MFTLGPNDDDKLREDICRLVDPHHVENVICNAIRLAWVMTPRQHRDITRLESEISSMVRRCMDDLRMRNSEFWKDL